jgi:hypothetical protein
MRLHTRFLSLLAVVGLAALSLPAFASAQAPDSSRSSIRVRAAGGVDLGIGDTYPWLGSVVGVLGLEWLHPRAPFSTRLDLSYFRDARDYGDVSEACAPFCRYAERFEMLGLSIDGRYTFLSRRPVRPYLLSGFGLYRSTTTVTASYTCRMNTCTATPGERSTFSTSSLAPGLHAGFGFAVPIRRSELSLEFRFQQLTSGIRYGHTVPITLGIRF